MGVSTDALLIYGYVWEDEHDLLGEDSGPYDEWEEIVARRRGIADPWQNHPGGSRPDWVEEHRADLDAWYAAKKSISEEYGVETDRHGSDEWTVPIVKISGAGCRAARGYPKAIGPDDLAVDPEWDGKLQRFVADLGIDTSEAKGPGWFLVSWWG